MQALIDIVPPGSNPTEAFLLMQMERIQKLECQIDEIQKTQQIIMSILHKTAQENVRFLENTEQGIVSVGKSQVAELLQTSRELVDHVSSLMQQTKTT